MLPNLARLNATTDSSVEDIISLNFDGDLDERIDNYLNENPVPLNLLTKRDNHIHEIKTLGINFWVMMRYHAFSFGEFDKGSYNRTATVPDSFRVSHDDEVAWKTLYGERFGQTKLIAREGAQPGEEKENFKSACMHIFGDIHGIGPRVFAAGQIKKNYKFHQFVVVERLDQTVINFFRGWFKNGRTASEFVKEKYDSFVAIDELFRRAASIGFLHGDGHASNIMFKTDNTGHTDAFFIDLDEKFMFADYRAAEARHCIYVAQLAIFIAHVASYTSRSAALRMPLVRFFFDLHGSWLRLFFASGLLEPCKISLEKHKAMHTILWFFMGRLTEGHTEMHEFLNLDPSERNVSYEEVLNQVYAGVAPPDFFERRVRQRT